MDTSPLQIDFKTIIKKYRFHLFVFFLVFFIGLTLAHPAVLLNDEFITTNQVRQLHAGHQFIVNEGRYGLAENGSMSGYFSYRSNILGYSLFLPVISLPAFWLIDLTGEQIAYVVLIVWTMTALILLLLIDHYFTLFSYLGKWRWTSAMAAIIFLLFFVNLYFYSKFTIDAVESYPEILAIVLTNIVLLAISGMLIYEICRTIFEDLTFSFFGCIVCLFSSSYFFWSTYCKDHILALVCFVSIVLFLVRFIKTDEFWYLPLAFMGCGLLAWIRPEIAFWGAILIVCICVYTLLRFLSRDRPGYSPLAVLCSPLWTFLGALPFFLNNYIVTGNVLLPVESLYLTSGNATVEWDTSHSLVRVGGSVNSLQSVIAMHLPSIPVSPFKTIEDLLGIFFYSNFGKICVFTLVPAFFVMIVIGAIFIIFKKIQFGSEDKRFIILLFLISGVVFMAYAYQIHSLNVDGGITPDIRYLSPLYFTLSLIGLIILKKINILPEDHAESIKELVYICVIGIPLSIILLCTFYPLHPNFIKGDIPIGIFFNLYVMAIIILTTIVLIYSLYQNCCKKIVSFMMLLLFAVPFFWQVNIIFLYFSFSGFAGHIFWIPVVHVFWNSIVNFMLLG